MKTNWVAAVIQTKDKKLLKTSSTLLTRLENLWQCLKMMKLMKLNKKEWRYGSFFPFYNNTATIAVLMLFSSKCLKSPNQLFNVWGPQCAKRASDSPFGADFEERLQFSVSLFLPLKVNRLPNWIWHLLVLFHPTYANLLLNTCFLFPAIQSPL